MPETVAAILGWVIPALVVFGVTAIALAVIAWAIRRSRRSPRARAAAEAVRADAGASLVRLDDAVDELELEVGLSGALYGGGAPTSLRRARMTAQHVRDDAFVEYRGISGSDMLPSDIRRVASRITTKTDAAFAAISRARAEHADWVAQNVSAADQIASARTRLAALRESMGDPSALVADLSSRFDEEEWREAARAARDATAEADAADELLAAATAAAADPSRSALADLAGAERSLRQAQANARALEETHRLVTQAAQALASEFDSARSALRHAILTREQLEPEGADRLGDEVRSIQDALSALETDAARRPTRTVDAIARLRDRLDLALGDARTAQQRLRGARTALPGTLAAARGAVARAEGAAAHGRSGADARVRLAAAQDELAAARRAQDPVEALDAARRAMRHAEDAQALADYDRLGAE
ncbi:hypothetical protein [uncultured Microbacterium sp.]|uniref:hypothetical protein n=1 Tax=uncultured Microbacterium sp. TaxID=191216 RepID=UPI0035CA2FEF